MKKETASSSETVAQIYQTTRLHVSVDHDQHSPPTEPQISYKLSHRPIMYLWSFTTGLRAVSIRKFEEIMTTRQSVIKRVRANGHSRIQKYCSNIRLQDVRKIKNNLYTAVRTDQMALPH
jgi:hypothetical protein